jgi:hypothetical protein
VFGDYIDIDTGQISMASPLGQTLLGKQVGDEVGAEAAARRAEAPNREPHDPAGDGGALDATAGQTERNTRGPARSRALPAPGVPVSALVPGAGGSSSTSERTIATSSATKAEAEEHEADGLQRSTSVSSGAEAEGRHPAAEMRSTMVTSPTSMPSTISARPDPPKNCIGFSLNFR